MVHPVCAGRSPAHHGGFMRHRRPPSGRNLPPPREQVPPATPEPGTAYAPSKGCRLAAERWPDGRVAAHFNGRWVRADADTFKPSGGGRKRAAAPTARDEEYNEVKP